jgi:hypothetical protein
LRIGQPAEDACEQITFGTQSLRRHTLNFVHSQLKTISFDPEADKTNSI